MAFTDIQAFTIFPFTQCLQAFSPQQWLYSYPTVSKVLQMLTPWKSVSHFFYFLIMCVLTNTMHLWVRPLFFRPSDKQLAAETDTHKELCQSLRSSQVDRESWQRLITMNNEWLTGSLYKELFRFGQTLTHYIFIIWEWTAVLGGWLIQTGCPICGTEINRINVV